MFGLDKFISNHTHHKSTGTKVSLDDLVIEQKNAYGLLPGSSKKSYANGSGNYRSPFKGRGMEFDEVREYRAGDDIRHLDWKVTAKIGKPFTKLFHEEKERPILLLVDMRPSMRFATKVAFKSVIAAKIAAMIVWSAKLAGDKLGGLVISGSKYTRLEPHKQRRRMLGFLGSITEASADSATTGGVSLSHAVGELRRVTISGGSVFVISDFHDFDEEVKKQFTMIASHSDLVCIYVHDKLEGTPPPAGVYRINNGQGKTVTINTADERWRKEYINTFAKRKQDVQLLCAHIGCTFISVATDDNIPDTLRKGLYYSQKSQGKRHNAA